MSTIKETLDERGKRYGSFADMSAAIIDLQRAMAKHDTRQLNSGQAHALGMIQVKIGRIITGDPNYDDNWRDIAGYALKVLDDLK